jgi:rhomboid protease GluP
MLNVLVFLSMGFSGASWANPNAADVLRWGADYGPSTLSGQWWRLLTSTFAHLGILHIGLNMWCLWSLGPILERLMGSEAFALIYLCSGLFASEVSLAWSPIRVSAGASGAIFGIAGAFFSFLYLKKAPLDVQFMRRKLKSLVALIFYNLFFGAVYLRVDNASHVGGLVAGLILGATVPGTTGKLLIGSGAVQHSAPELGDAPSVSRASRNQENRRLVVVAMVSLLVLIVTAIGIRKHYAAIAKLGMAARLVQTGEPTRAVSELQEAIALDPKQPLTHEMLGILLLEQQDPDGAYPVLENAIEGDINNRLLRHNLALAYIGAGYPKEAKQEISWALQAPNEDQGAAHYILGLCAYLDKDFDQATKQLIAASQERADLFEAQDALARVYIEMGRTDQARTAYTEVLSAHKEDPASILGLAYLSNLSKTRPDSADLPLFAIPYYKLTAKSRLWPFHP